MSELIRCPYCKIGTIPEKWTKANPDYILVRRADFEESLRVSANTWFRHFKAAMSKAVDWKYLKENPCQGVKQLAVDEPLPRYLTQDEFARILAAGLFQRWLMNEINHVFQNSTLQGDTQAYLTHADTDSRCPDCGGLGYIVREDGQEEQCICRAHADTGFVAVRRDDLETLGAASGWDVEEDVYKRVQGVLDRKEKP